jgi:hypothetical protein
MDRASSVDAVVVDVARPCLALDVDEDAACGFFEVHRHQRTHVALDVGEGEVLLLEASVGVVVHGTDVLDVCGVLAGAIHPHDAVLQTDRSNRIVKSALSAVPFLWVPPRR